MITASDYHLSPFRKLNFLGLSDTGQTGDIRLEECTTVKPVKIVSVFTVIHDKVSIIHGHAPSVMSSAVALQICLCTHTGLRYALVVINAPSSMFRVCLRCAA